MKKTVWIKTYGCQMNERDSETLKFLLQKEGFDITEKENEADIALLNTCSIRDLAEAKALGKAGRLLKTKKQRPDFKVGILGCMASRLKEQLKKRLPGVDFIVPPQALNEVPQILKDCFSETGYLAPIPESFEFQAYEEHTIHGPSVFVPIQQGCNMACSYCIVPKTRGEQQNRPMQSILKEVACVVEQGAREIILLGQIVNTYQDPETKGRFVDLLKAVHAIQGVERIRFMSPHPAFFNDALIQAFKDLPHLCPSVHLPIQSGSNTILKNMKRAYTREKILKIVQALRDINPQISISTDVIVGYPGETENDFEETYTLFDQIAFDMAYIFKYSPRPTTIAAPQEQTAAGIPEEIKEARNQRLLSLLNKHSLKYNQQFLGTTQNILVEGAAHRGINKLFGRNVYNKKVIIEGPKEWIGQFKNVHVLKAGSSVLEGKVLDD